MESEEKRLWYYAGKKTQSPTNKVEISSAGSKAMRTR